MPVQLNAQASAALAEIVRKNNGQLPMNVEQKLAAIEQSATQSATPAAPLTLKDVEQILADAMPAEQKGWIKDACDVGSGYHPDGKNAQFLTKILSTRVEKVDEVQAGNTQPAVPRRYDPYHAEFDLDPKAQSMLLFNARNVDRSGNALLMKVVMRMTPKVDAVVGQGRREIDGLVKENLAVIRASNSNVSEMDVRSFMGLPTDGSADANNVAWINQRMANAAWAQQNWPQLGAGKERIADLSKQVAEAEQRFIDEQLPRLDLSRYRREPADAKPDVTLVGPKDTYVKTSDLNESEFTFGDPLKQVSLNAANKEISSSVFVRPENDQFSRAWNDPRGQTGRRVDYDRHAVGDHLDSQAVSTFDDRIRVAVKAKAGQELQPGSWLDEPNGLRKLDVQLHLDRGLIYEPGAQAQVTILNKSFGAKIEANDAQLLGNAAQQNAVDTSATNMTVRQFLQSNVSRTSWASNNQSDAQGKQFNVASLVYANAASIKVGSRALNPLGDTTLMHHELAANKMKLDAVVIEDPEKDGARVRLTLEDGFLGADADKASVKGYTIQVGYFDDKDQWIEAKTRTVGGETRSKAESFEFNIADLNALNAKKDPQGQPTKHLEIRLYNADGVPAERIKIPFREVKWADD